MTNDNETLALTLRDGLTLSYAEFGDPAGVPLIYCHGHPGSRLEGRQAHEAALKLGMRVIAADRPGYGSSSPKSGRKILDWPDDVAELADALGIGRFAVTGGSGGAPFALASAYKLLDRVTVAGIVSGFAPIEAPGATVGMRLMNRVAFKYLSRLPLLPDLIMSRMAAKMRKDPDAVMKRLEAAFSPSKREAIEAGSMRTSLKEIITESFRQGSKAAADEVRLLGRPWGFRLEDIRVPLQLWQGTDDPLVPESMGRYMASVLPECQSHFVEGEGHLLIMKRMEEIIGALKARAA